MREDGGQALVVLVMALAIGATAIVGLRTAQGRIVEAARVHRAGEAAVEAAAQSLADAYVAHRVSATDLPADAHTVEGARIAAEDLARENGAGGVEAIEVVCAAGRIEARLVLAGYAHRAGFSAPECSQR